MEEIIQENKKINNKIININNLNHNEFFKNIEENNDKDIYFFPIGGFGEYGRNSMALAHNKKIFLFDFGNKFINVRSKVIFPNISLLKELIKKKYIIEFLFISHAHMDHIGGVKFLLDNFNIPKIYLGKFTKEFLLENRYVNEEYIKNLIEIHDDQEINNNNYKLKFNSVQHSIPDTYFCNITINNISLLYASDFKFDNNPIIGKSFSHKNFKNIYTSDILFLDVTCINKKGFVKSEQSNLMNLEDMFLKHIENENNIDGNIYISTFSSQISRLKMILKLCNKYNLTPYICGKALKKNISIAKKLDMLEMVHEINIDELRKNMNNIKNSCFIITGHQGEESAILFKLASDENIRFNKTDKIILSSTEIPDEVVKLKRGLMIKLLNEKNILLIDELHTSGHCYKEDLKYILNLKKSIIFPMHANLENISILSSLNINDSKIIISKNNEIYAIKIY